LFLHPGYWEKEERILVTNKEEYVIHKVSHKNEDLGESENLYEPAQPTSEFNMSNILIWLDLTNAYHNQVMLALQSTDNLRD
jgi:hypothetical protein